MKLRTGASYLLFLLFISCNNDDAAADNPGSTPEKTTTQLSYTIASTYPHDTSAYTQGLEFYEGQLLEGTGNYGKSKLLQRDLQTGKAVKSVALDSSYFGEGITVLHDTLYQLTWKEKKVILYSAKDFKKIKELPLNTEGWGLTNDGKNLIATDGSNNLYFYEPGTFRLMRTQSVTENGAPAVNLNELEYINGYLYANQYSISNYIFKIDPESGHVLARLDLADLTKRVKASHPQISELNGIAYNPETKKVYVTGKHWPQLFELAFAF
jgi:glutamine cyclotransferase